MKNLIFAFILIGLFGFLILTAVVETSNHYGTDTSDVLGGSMTIQKFNTSISGISSDAQKMQDRFQSGSVFSAFMGVVIYGIFGIMIDMFKMILFPFNLISNIMLDVFHIPIAVTGVILGLLIFAGIFAIYRLTKIGE